MQQNFFSNHGLVRIGICPLMFRYRNTLWNNKDGGLSGFVIRPFRDLRMAVRSVFHMLEWPRRTEYEGHLHTSRDRV